METSNVLSGFDAAAVQSGQADAIMAGITIKNAKIMPCLIPIVIQKLSLFTIKANKMPNMKT